VGSGPINGVAKLVSMNNELATKIIIDAKIAAEIFPISETSFSNINRL